MFDRWRNRRLEARSSAAYDSVRIPFPIPAAHLAGHRTCVDDRSPVTEYATAKIQPAKPAVLQDRAEETADYRTTKILPGKLIMLNDQNGAEETAVIYLTDPSGRGAVEIGRGEPGRHQRSADQGQGQHAQPAAGAPGLLRAERGIPAGQSGWRGFQPHRHQWAAHGESGNSPAGERRYPPDGGRPAQVLRIAKTHRPLFYSLKEAQVIVEQWREEYNTRRPHSAFLLPNRFHDPRL